MIGKNGVNDFGEAALSDYRKRRSEIAGDALGWFVGSAMETRMEDDYEQKNG
jgi:hypothetical protein